MFLFEAKGPIDKCSNTPNNVQRDHQQKDQNVAKH